MKLKNIGIAFGLLIFSISFAFLPVAQTMAAGGLCNGPAFTRLGVAGCHGYFTNNGTKNFQRPAPYGTVGDNVINCKYSSIGCANGTGPDNAIPFNGSNCTAPQLPCGVQNAAQFEQWMGWYLNTGYNYNHSGAAFIIDAMLGRQGTSFSSVTAGINYAVAHFQEWKGDVDYYQAQGWITWNDVKPVFADQINSMHVCSTTYTGTCTRNNITQSAYDGRDFVFFREQADEPSHLIEFHNPDGTVFEIRRECANLVGNVSPLTPAPNPTVTPSCGAMIINPGRPDPRQAFSVQVTVSYANTGQATTVVSSANKMKLSVSGPGINYSNANVTMKQNGADINGNSPSLGPSNNTGTYTVNWGVTGSDIPTADINCNGTFVIADEPYFSVDGGDVSAGASMGVGGTDCATTADPNGGIVSWNQENATYAGAGTQQAAFALNFLQDFATAQGTASLVPTGLGFSNTNNVDTSGGGNDTYGGALGSSECAPDYFSGHPTTALYSGGHTFNTATDLGTAGSPKIFYMTGNLTIPGAVNVPNGSHTVIYVDGSVQINGNILYSNSYPGGIKDIPSLTIVARGNIFVAGLTVSELDGWYIAEPSSSTATNGIFYSCASGFAATPLNQNLYNNCNRQLKIYGSIVARQVWFGRTNGTLYANTRSERVFFTPESWLSSPFSSGSASGDGYDAITSLPPSL